MPTPPFSSTCWRGSPPPDWPHFFGAVCVERLSSGRPFLRLFVTDVITDEICDAAARAIKHRFVTLKL
jgi:hypothetical protein